MNCIRLGREIHEPVLRQVRERLPFFCKEIVEVCVDPDDLQNLLFRTQEGVDAGKAIDQLRRLVEESLDSYRHVPSETIFEHRSAREHPRRKADTRADEASVLIAESGLATLGNGLLLALNRFEDLFGTWATELGATERRYPSLLPFRTLSRAGYPESFPHHLTFVGHLREERVTVEAWVARSELPSADSVELSKHVLAPAVCYHCYADLAGQTLTRQPLILTACGRCFRHEGRRLKSPERLWEFTMQEIVVLGSSEQVEELRRRLIDKTCRLVEQLDLDGTIVTANDPFFTSTSAGQLLLQRLKALKYELQLEFDDSGHTVAATSFNHHEEFFGKRFDITTGDGKFAHSACVAFGLERWAYAFVRRHGGNPSGWPATLADPGRETEN